MSSIQTEIQSLGQDTLVEMFEIDLTPIGLAEHYYFHNGVNELGNDVVWQGVTYVRYPIEAEGFEMNGTGSQPRPVLRAANISGLLSAAVRDNHDLVRAKVIRRRTYLKFLDAVNFSGAVNPSADPAVYLNDEVWLIDRKSVENRLYIEWELAAAFDLTNIMLPKNQVIQSVCTSRYRSAECGYVGGPVATINDVPTSDSALDDCGHRLKSCTLRNWPNNELPFSGFPGAGLFQS